MYGNVSGSDYQPRLDMSRPSAKSIYMQRKEYSETVHKQPDAFQYRVEHLFTSELDNRELSSIDDCVAKLKSLESRGKVWGQDMILQLQGSSLKLCDIESKEVLESIPLGSISQTKAILDSCTYDSLLAVTVHGNGRGPPKIFFFQCEETGAEEVRGDLDRAILHSDDPRFQPNEPMMDIRTNLENIIGQGYSMSFRRPGLSPMQPAPASPPPAPASPPPAPEFYPPQLNTYQEYGKEYEDPVFMNRDEARYSPEMFEPPSRSAQPSPPPPPLAPQYKDIDRSLEIFNHVVDDIEIFRDKVGAALEQEAARKKQKKKDKTPRRYGENFPSIQEYISCLQKFKYAFNILAKVSDHLRNPEAPVFIHSLFISLSYLVSKFPPDVPGSILSPFFTEPALQLLTQVVTPEEDRLWSSFGDTWHVPRSKWPNGDKMAPYVPVFYDGWEPPMPVPPQYTPPVTRQPSQSGSQRFPDRRSPQPPPPQDNRSFGAPPARSDGPPLYMRVIYDFTARNRQELSVLKGEVVQVVDKSRQWWIVRNNRQEEGHVPQNVLEPMGGEEPAQRTNRPPNLDTRSSPEEVRNWLQYKGFSKATVRNLGMMNGALLLGMKRDDMRAVCPEEGGRVFFQLQAVKSALALASEAEYNQYGGR